MMGCEIAARVGCDLPRASSALSSRVFVMAAVVSDGLGGTYDSWRYHVSYRINDIFHQESSHFNNPRIRSRLEKLMGSNVVRITDRKYMIKLQERIKEDHLENQKKRIQERESEEVEREKKLILEGKIPIESAPKELKNHPLCKINQITKKILEEKKVGGKSKLSSKLAGYKTFSRKLKDSEKAKQDEAAGKESGDREEDDQEGDQSEAAGGEEGEAEAAEEQPKGFVLGKEEYEKLKYEAPLVKKLKEVEGVEEMYKLAEEIVGPLKHQKTAT